MTSNVHISAVFDYIPVLLANCCYYLTSEKGPPVGSPGWPQAYNPASTSGVLGLWVHATVPGSSLIKIFKMTLVEIQFGSL